MKFTNLSSNPSLSQRVSQQIEDAIISGGFPAHAKLPTEDRLGEMFGVSRTVVREALQNLKANGLLKSKTGSGNYVEQYGLIQLSNAVRRYGSMNQTNENLMQYIGFRRMIEVESIRNLAKAPDEAAINKLETLITRMSELSERDFKKRWQLDMEFHSTIIKHSKNELLYTLFKPLSKILHDYIPKNKDIIFHRKDIDRITREHTEILESIRERDEETAAKLIETHIITSHPLTNPEFRQ